MRESSILVLASNNRGKFLEFKDLFAPYGRELGEINLCPAQEFISNASKLSEVETFDTYSENSKAKARTANLACHYPCLGDDSGLEVDALDAAPGARSARFAIAKAGESQSDANMNKLLEEMNGKTDRTARFKCSLSLVMEGILVEAEGTLEGKLTETPRGERGFGYDPIFVPNGSSKTLAEMTADEKNEISHRAVALRDLMVKVNESGIVFARV